ncbi:MAG: hypothetical protein ACR2O4_01110 [Hyphomicrobiaceae bacterium]
MSSPGSTSRSERPSRLWYLLALFMVLAGLAAMAVVMLPRIMSMGDALVQVVVPGEAELVLDKAGTYTIFHERHSVVDGQVFVSETVTGLRVKVVSAGTGTPVPIAPASVGTNYSIGGRSGSSIFTFEIETPGRYRIAAAYDDGRPEPRAVLSVGHGFLAALLRTIFGALAIAFSGVIAAVAAAAVVWRKRKVVPVWEIKC